MNDIRKGNVIYFKSKKYNDVCFGIIEFVLDENCIIVVDDNNEREMITVEQIVKENN